MEDFHEGEAFLLEANLSILLKKISQILVKIRWILFRALTERVLQEESEMRLSSEYNKDK